MDKSYYRDSLVFKGHLDNNVYQEVPLESDKNVFKKFKSLVEKYRSNLTKRKVDYLTNFKLQSSNIYCTPKLHKCKTSQETIGLSTDDYIEVFQPEDLKARPAISGSEISTQWLSCLIENFLKPIIGIFYNFYQVSSILIVYFIHVALRIYVLVFYLYRSH